MRWLPANVWARVLKRRLPTSLWGRSLLIIVLPVLVMQVAVTCWSSTTTTESANCSRNS